MKGLDALTRRFETSHSVHGKDDRTEPCLCLYRF